MAKNQAAVRHAKALRRKKVVAEKKKAEAFETSLPGQVAAALPHPIQHCLISQGWEQTNVAQVWLGRGATPTDVFVAVFLVDTLSMGVKDVYSQPMIGPEFEQALAGMGGGVTMVPIEPAKARKLLREAVAWARKERVLPHPDYATLERLFGDVDPAASDAVFHFGLEGMIRAAAPPEAASGFDTAPAAGES